MSFTMYAGAAFTVAAKFDMNAASSAGDQQPEQPGGHEALHGEGQDQLEVDVAAHRAELSG